MMRKPPYSHPPFRSSSHLLTGRVLNTTAEKDVARGPRFYLAAASSGLFSDHVSAQHPFMRAFLNSLMQGYVTFFPATSGLLISNHMQPQQVFGSSRPSPVTATASTSVHTSNSVTEPSACRIAPYIGVPPIHHRLSSPNLISFADSDRSEVACDSRNASFTFAPPAFDTVFLNAAHQVILYKYRHFGMFSFSFGGETLPQFRPSRPG